MTQSQDSPFGGTSIDRDVRTGRDFIGRDSIVNQSIYSGLDVQEMFRLRLVLAYEKLWSLMEPLALYEREQPVTYAVLRTLSATLRRWYFQDAGGMYMLQLSSDHPTRKAYLALQDILKQIVESKPSEVSVDAEVSEDEFKRARDASSEVRHAMAAELRGVLVQGRRVAE